MVNKNIIVKKIGLIKHSLQRIEKYKGFDYESISNNEDIQDIVIHNLFISIQYIIDIGSHIIADDSLGEVGILSDIPEILAKEGIIKIELVKPIKNMFGFRNILAHQYGDLDLKVVYNIINNNLKEIYEYLDEIVKYCRL